MSLRSGVFTKYVMEFEPGGLRVSSDARAGALCLDADIHVRMSRGSAGAGFEVKLYDLPEPKSRALAEAIAGPAAGRVKLLRVRIDLGYLDTEMAAVMNGICEHVVVLIEGDRRVTIVRGREAASHACSTAACPELPDDSLPVQDAVIRLLASAVFAPDCVDRSPVLWPPLPDGPVHLRALRSRSVLTTLDDIAAWSGCDFMVGDGRVWFGRGPAGTGAAPKVLDRSVNLVAFEPFTLLTAEAMDGAAAPSPVAGFRFKALGDPGLRPAQAVQVLGVAGHPGPGWRVRHLEHRYNAADGYVCTGVATLRLASAAQGRHVDALTERNAASAASTVAACLRRLARTGTP